MGHCYLEPVLSSIRGYQNLDAAALLVLKHEDAANRSGVGVNGVGVWEVLIKKHDYQLEEVTRTLMAKLA